MFCFNHDRAVQVKLFRRDCVQFLVRPDLQPTLSKHLLPVHKHRAPQLARHVGGRGGFALVVARLMCVLSCRRSRGLAYDRDGLQLRDLDLQPERCARDSKASPEKIHVRVALKEAATTPACGFSDSPHFGLRHHGRPR